MTFDIIIFLRARLGQKLKKWKSKFLAWGCRGGNNTNMEVRAIIDIQPQTEITGVKLFSKIINVKHFSN